MRKICYNRNQLNMKSVLCFAMLLLNFYSNGQKISIQELISFQNKDISVISTTLTSKGWQYDHSKQENGNSLSIISWSFGAISDNNYCDITIIKVSDNYNRVLFSTTDKDIYLKYVKQIKVLTKTKPENKVGDNQITSTYKIGKAVLKQETKKLEGGFVYHFNIFLDTDVVYLE